MNWQPIETAPKNGSRFYTYSPGSPDFSIGVWCDFHQRYEDDAFHGTKFTHWAPFPEPPK